MNVIIGDRHYNVKVECISSDETLDSKDQLHLNFECAPDIMEYGKPAEWVTSKQVTHHPAR